MSVRNIVSVTGVLALSVLAACSRGGSSLSPASNGQSFQTSDVSAQASGQVRQYSLKDGDSVVEVKVASEQDRGEGKVEANGSEYTVRDISSAEGDKVAAVVSRKKGNETQHQRILLQKNAEGAFTTVCVMDGNAQDEEKSVEGALGELLVAAEQKACKPVSVKQEVKEAVKTVGEKVDQAVEEVKK